MLATIIIYNEKFHLKYQHVYVFSSILIMAVITQSEFSLLKAWATVERIISRRTPSRCPVIWHHTLRPQSSSSLTFEAPPALVLLLIVLFPQQSLTLALPQGSLTSWEHRNNKY